MSSKSKKLPVSSPGFPPKTSAADSFWKSWLLPGGLLFLITLLLYGPSYRAGYIWDDDAMAANALVRGGWEGLRDIWFSAKYGDFVPLTATTFWLEWQLGGGSPQLQHFTNILLHALNVVLVWRVLHRLKIPGAWVAAALFAAHPLCVTSVTWVAERKNTLSMLFYLLSLLYYFKSECPEDRSRLPRYWLSFVFFVLALLSKSSVVVLPCVFLLCAWWRTGRIARSDILRSLPFFGVALAAGIATLVAHYYFAPKLGIQPTGDSLLVRMLAGTRAVWFYLAHTFWPANVTMHYPRWEIDAGSILSFVPGVVMVGVLVLFWRFRQRWGKACLFGFGYFILAVAPALGVFKMAYLKFSQVADHFQYLALPGLIALLVGGLFSVVPSASRTLHRAAQLCFCLLFVSLAALSWQHQRLVGNAEALWRDNLKKYPSSWVAHNNLGNELNTQGRHQEAEEHFRAALTLQPDVPEILYGLGSVLVSQRRYPEAIEALRGALRLFPDHVKAHNNLAVALQRLGKVDEASFHYQEAIRLNPANAEARCNLGFLFARQGQWSGAIEQFQSAVQIDSTLLIAHHNLGLLLSANGKLQEAKAHLHKALQLDAPKTLEFVQRSCALAGPQSVALLDAMSLACADAGRSAEAAVAMEQAIRLADAAGQTVAVTGYRHRLELYRQSARK